MKFKILTIKDKKDWLYLIEKLLPELQDLHFLPEYGEIYQKTYGFEPFLAFYGDENNYTIQPFVKRRLNDLPFLKDQKIKKEFYDIANPYGYGGPLYQGKSLNRRKIYQEFDRNLRQYLKKEKIASEFCSLHPFLENHKLAKLEQMIKKEKEIVYFDLTLDEKDIITQINRGTKSNINKAKRLGIKIKKMDPSLKNFNVFKKLYYQTMKRQKAAERWFFPKDYFWNCLESLGEKRASLFFAFKGKEVASAYLLIHNYQNCYYHFGASDERFFSMRPNNLLMYETALWAKRQGFRRYHLGGGVTKSDEDSLYRFKSGFTKETALLYVYKRLHHLPTYNYLCKLKKQYEKKTLGKEIKSDYFPLYRR